MKKTIFIKLINSYVLVIFIILGVLGVSVSWMVKGFLYDQREKQLTLQGNEIVQLIQPILLEGESPSNVINLLNRADLALGREVWVVDPQGIVIAAAAAHEYCEGNALAESEMDEVLSGRVATWRGGSQYFDEAVIRVTIPIYDHNQDVMGAIILYTPIFEINQTVRGLLEVLFICAVIALLLAIIVAFILSKRIADPLFSLTSLSHQMASGNRNIKAEENTEIVEINHLSKSFNAMVSQIEQNERKMKDFVANVSHELRTPLTSIQGFTEALRDDKGKNQEDRKRYLEIILRETNRLKNLVNTLLSMSKHGNVMVDMQKCNLNKLVLKKVKDFEPQLYEASIATNIQLEVEGPWIEVNVASIEQVIVNLLDNALKYSPVGGTITITTKEIQEGVSLSIQDQGCGIPESELPLIWERFYRIDKARGRDSGGSGLGLAIVREQVEMNGGTVTASSIVGVGSTFTLIFPKTTKVTQ